jgi:glycosyltransferase involved in cell wall biosynthesis
MRIIIDLQGAQTGSRHRGIGRYTLSLVKAIVRNKGKHEIILVLNGLFPETIETIRAEFEDVLPQRNIRVWNAPGGVAEIDLENTWRRNASELIREAFIESLKPDFIILTTLFEGFGDDFVASIGSFDQNTPVVVILYDLIPLINIETYLADPSTLAWYKNKVEHCKRASLLLSISESSRQESIKYLGTEEEAVINISSAADEIFRPLDFSLLEQNKLNGKFGLKKSYLMYSGATDYRKNHLMLIKAYSKLPLSIRSSHQLVIVGGLPDDHRFNFVEHSKKCGLKNDELIITGRVSDHDMVALYNLCKAFISPSWHEGFGLPALEAMKCGKAVIVSNTSSLPEVVDKLEAQFDPFNEGSITAKIEQVLTNNKFRKELEQYALKRSKLFSWDFTAQHSINALECFHTGYTQAKKSSHSIYKKDTIKASLIENIATLPTPTNPNDIINTAIAISQNHQPYKSSQLFIDISELHQNDAGTGIQRVTRSLLLELLKNPPDGFCVEPVYATDKTDYRYARKFTRSFLGVAKNNDIDDLLEYNVGDIFLGLDLLHPSIASFNENFYQTMRNYGVEVCFVAYDILPVLLPQFANDGVTAGHKEWLQIIGMSDGVICISKTVANEVDAWMKEYGPKKIRRFTVNWFHLGADIESSAPSNGIPENSDLILNKLKNSYSFLMVGTVESRKGYSQTLSSFEILWKQGVDVILVIAGKPGWFVDELINKIRNHTEFGGRLYWPEGISDEYLEKLYSSCHCLIAPSEGEGFGLPLVEAAQHKLPIIARDIPVFNEIAEQHAFYFSGKSSENLASTINEWLELYKSDKHPKSDDMPWLSWKESANQLKKLLRGNSMRYCNRLEGILC